MVSPWEVGDLTKKLQISTILKLIFQLQEVVEFIMFYHFVSISMLQRCCKKSFHTQSLHNRWDSDRFSPV